MSQYIPANFMAAAGGALVVASTDTIVAGVCVLGAAFSWIEIIRRKQKDAE